MSHCHHDKLNACVPTHLGDDTAESLRRVADYHGMTSSSYIRHLIHADLNRIRDEAESMLRVLGKATELIEREELGE